MKRTIPSAALVVIPNCGHAINIEEPDEFNRMVGDFLAQVESGRWPMRDPRACRAQSPACGAKLSAELLSGNHRARLRFPAALLRTIPSGSGEVRN